MTMGPDRAETKNDCVGEGQLQCRVQARTELELVGHDLVLIW
jgi:hypothetical protein